MTKEANNVGVITNRSARGVGKGMQLMRRGEGDTQRESVLRTEQPRRIVSVCLVTESCVNGSCLGGPGSAVACQILQGTRLQARGVDNCFGIAGCTKWWVLSEPSHTHVNRKMIS